MTAWQYRIAWWHWLPGFALVIFGAFFLWEGSAHSMGTTARIGPGFFPAGVSGLLIITGLAVICESALARDPRPELRFRPMVMVIAGILLWAVTLESFGLYPATFILVLVSALGEREFRPVPNMMLALVLSVLSHLIFIVGFRLPFQPVTW